VPSLWSDNQAQLLGDVHVLAWHLREARRGACFACLRPATADAPTPAEAQRGLAAEVVRVAGLTAEIVLGVLLADSPQHRILMRQLTRGACYFVIPRWPPGLRAVVTRPRRNCPACAAIAPVARQPANLDPATIREWSIAAVLGSAVLWHQMVPGLDWVATVAFVGVVGLWWRGWLPSFRQAAAWVRRNLRVS
jgi:hypothetical protein